MSYVNLGVDMGVVSISFELVFWRSYEKDECGAWLRMYK